MFVFKNVGDTVRFNIHKRETEELEWDVDIWTKNEGGRTTTVSSVVSDEGEWFPLKRDAKAEMVRRFGKLISINPKETVTEGWK